MVCLNTACRRKQDEFKIISKRSSRIFCSSWTATSTQMGGGGPVGGVLSKGRCVWEIGFDSLASARFIRAFALGAVLAAATGSDDVSVGWNTCVSSSCSGTSRVAAAGPET